jgi:hypothetical protein
MPKKKYRCEETLDLEDYIQQKEEREKLQLGSKTYDKCSALESEILDQQFDTDEYGYARPDKFVTPIEASLVRIEEFFNQVIAPLLPKTLRIQLDRNGLMIWDYEYGIERRYHLQQVDPLHSEYSMHTAEDQFAFLVAEAEAKAMKERTVIRRGEWYQLPDQVFDRYTMHFEKGGVVPCGLQSGEDNIPYYNDGTPAIVGLGEYIWSRPAICALAPNYELEHGVKILHHIHETLRLKAGRDEAYGRTYGR